MEIAINHDLSTEEILQKFSKQQRRTIFRRIQHLKETNQILSVRIRGKGKRPRWIIPEEQGNDIWIRAIPDDIDWKNPRIINAMITQRYLSRMISDEKRFYQKELKKSKKNKEPYENFVFYHVAVASKCMTWILQLTWAINAGVFSESENKLTLAYRNRERYEKFLNQVIYNLKIRDEEAFKSISSTIYNRLTHMSLIDIFYPTMIPPYELVIPKPNSLH